LNEDLCIWPPSLQAAAGKVLHNFRAEKAHAKEVVQDVHETAKVQAAKMREEAAAALADSAIAQNLQAFEAQSSAQALQPPAALPPPPPPPSRPSGQSQYLHMHRMHVQMT